MGYILRTAEVGRSGTPLTICFLKLPFSVICYLVCMSERDLRYGPSVSERHAAGDRSLRASAAWIFWAGMFVPVVVLLIWAVISWLVS